ncbi:MAG: methylated-DNA-protein-cysteine methyltransferase-like protein [Oleiphilaceae bacterium]|jgi:methylated-DNA-protein-cysteine methyltransferase-like protein
MPNFLPENTSKADAIFITLAHIPFGKVSTYGDVAKQSGYPGLARYVAKILKDLPHNTKIPWHRVINSQGKSSFPANSAMYSLQLSKLQKEGVILSKSNIIPKQFFW